MSSSTSALLQILEKGESLSAACSTTTSSPLSHAALPSEVLYQCLVEYADWGDLARLSCVQSSWSDIMYRKADVKGRQSKWELAQALLDGTNGLESNPAKAMALFLELANVAVDETNNNMPVTEPSSSQSDNNNNNDENCFAPAMKKVATCYFTGVGVEQSDSAAGCAWLECCFVKGGDVDAAHELGFVYEYGRHGVKIDVVKAAEWFRKAAEAGNADAMTELALCYELGCGVEQDDEEALDWYMMAAELGHVTAKYSVAEAFEEARGVPQSDAEACLWYYKAAKAGCDDSRVALRRLEDVARIVVPGVRSLLDG